jgi:hypothetical protein
MEGKHWAIYGVVIVIVVVHAVRAVDTTNRNRDGLRPEEGHAVPKVGSSTESLFLAPSRALPDTLEIFRDYRDE